MDDPRLPPLLPAVLRKVEVGGTLLMVLDESHPELLYGGNKVRKLRGLLWEATCAGATDLLTFGAIGSHHVLATALWGNRLGLRTHAIWIAQPETPHVVQTASAAYAACKSVSMASSLAELTLVTATLIAQIVANTGRAPFRIPPGGSSVAGTRGWVQLAETLMVDVDEVVVASGSGGTAAGMLAGVIPVRAVRVGPRALTNRPRLRSLAKRAGATTLAPLQIEHGFLGGGYGCVDAVTQDAWQCGQSAGLPVETTYSAKALACALSLARTGRRVLFVQTASSPAPSSPKGLPAVALPLLLKVEQW